MSATSANTSALTTRGRAFVAAGLACAVCAFLLGQKDLLRVAILLSTLPLVTLALVARSRYRISAHRSIDPGRVTVGQTANVRLHVQNEGRMRTGLLLLEDQVPYELGARPRFVLDRLGARWRRDIDYPVRADTRGRFTIGPAGLRVTDPFGLVELSRSFQSSVELLVTPRVHALPHTRLGFGAAPESESRPRAVAFGGHEDASVREYRRGDDLRRVHWRSSARRGELMVRREEQPWQSRATVFLDTRRTAHRGQGPGSSFEWAISAAASVAIHLLHRGYVLHLVTDTGANLGASNHATGLSDPEGTMLSALATIELSESAEVAHADRSPIGAAPDPGGLLVAIVGFGDPAEIPYLDHLRRGASGAFLIGLDPAAHGYDSWPHVIAGPEDGIATVWSRLLTAGSPNPSGAMAR